MAAAEAEIRSCMTRIISVPLSPGVVTRRLHVLARRPRPGRGFECSGDFSTAIVSSAIQADPVVASNITASTIAKDSPRYCEKAVHASTSSLFIRSRDVEGMNRSSSSYGAMENTTP